MSVCDGLVHLRRAGESDARGIAEVHVRSWRQAYRGLMPDAVLDSLDVDVRERFWHREISLTNHDRRPWLAADSDGDVVGFVSAGPADNQPSSQTGEIYAIYVLAECWDRGVGRSLLQHAVRDLREHGYAEGTLWVLATNERARDFYEAASWHADGAERTETFGGAELREVRYQKALH